MFVVAVHEGEHGRHLVQQKGRWRLGAVGVQPQQRGPP
jgi:hypothetical protein